MVAGLPLDVDDVLCRQTAAGTRHAIPSSMPTMTHEQAQHADANDRMLDLSTRLNEALILAKKLANWHGVDMVALGLDPKVIDALEHAASDAYTLNRVVVTKF